MHRFFVDKKLGGESFVLDNKEQVQQITRVLRLSEGDRAVFFDNSGFEFESEMTERNDKMLYFDIMEKREGIGFDREIVLYVSLIRRENFELVFQKATELGASRIVPMLSKRCVKNEISENGFERLKAIMIEATEQSHGSIVPTLGKLLKFEEAIQDLKESNLDLSLIAYEEEKTKSFDEVIKTHKGSIGIMVGPEGGFAPEEYQLAKKSGIISVSLGKRVLRAETAAIAVLSKILL